MSQSPYISFPNLNQFPELLCAFSTRQGGVSISPFESLNMGWKTGDHPQNVCHNRNIFYSALGINQDNIAYTDQIHSANVEIIDRPGRYNQCDALISIRRGLFLAVVTADCFPVFIYAPSKQVVSVIHAGWRGTVNGIVHEVLNKLKDQCSVNLNECIVAIGPGMQSECFEVKSDVFKRIPEKFIGDHLSQEHRYIDLSGLIVEQLVSEGISATNIFRSHLCTKCKSNLFYSYRRDRQNSGRMLGIIGLRK